MSLWYKGTFVALGLGMLLGAAPATAPPAPPPEAAADPLAPLAFLAGCWGSEDDGRFTEECWMAPKAGLMLGMNRTAPGPVGGVSFEYLRIEARGEKVVYIPSPGGREGPAFTLDHVGEGVALFVNNANDFPKRIRYALVSPGVLEARIDGGPEEPAKVMGWTWRRMPPPEGGEHPPGPPPPREGQGPGAEGGPPPHGDPRP